MEEDLLKLDKEDLKKKLLDSTDSSEMNDLV